MIYYFLFLEQTNAEQILVQENAHKTEVLHAFSRRSRAITRNFEIFVKNRKNHLFDPRL